VVALVIVASAMAARAAVPVTLRLAGATDRDVGQAVRLTATAKLPAGAHLLIQRSVGRKAPVKVAECPRSPCTGSYRDAKQEDVNFQALAIRRSGTSTTILGRSKRIAVSWIMPATNVPPTTAPSTPPPSPPPPSPAATPGHYQGKTADNELFAFDISPDARGLMNLQTGQMNESCDPPAYLSGGDISAPGPFPVALDGSFTITGAFAGTVGGNPSTEKITITGRVSGAVASGTYREDTSFTESNGTGYNCSTGNQTWSAAKTG
jgi:hypothetical protein